MTFHFDIISANRAGQCCGSNPVLFSKLLTEAFPLCARLESIGGKAGLCDYFLHSNLKKMNIRFYTSDAKDNSIIAYGDTHQKDRHFKITYKKGRYYSFKKRCAKYIELAESQSLEDAKQVCIISEDFHSQPDWHAALSS